MNRGEVVLVDWPYSDRTGGKMRPAVVVQADYLNGVLDDTVVVHITSKKHGIPGTEVELDPANETASGLLRISYAFCPNVLTARPCVHRLYDRHAVRPGDAEDRGMSEIDAGYTLNGQLRWSFVLIISPWGCPKPLPFSCPPAARLRGTSRTRLATSSPPFSCAGAALLRGPRRRRGRWSTADWPRGRPG